MSDGMISILKENCRISAMYNLCRDNKDAHFVCMHVQYKIQKCFIEFFFSDRDGLKERKIMKLFGKLYFSLELT